MNPIKTIYNLSIENSKDIRKVLVYKKGRLYYDNKVIYSLRSSSLLSIDIIEFDGEDVVISGRIKSPIMSDLSFFVKDNKGNVIDIDQSVMRATTLNKQVVFADDYMISYVYEIRLKAIESSYIFYVSYKGQKPIRVRVHMGKHVPFSDGMDEMTYIKNGICISYNSIENRLIFKKKKAISGLKKSLKIFKRCLKDNKINMAAYRLYKHLFGWAYSKPVWLVMDRINVAGDNGEHLYKYILSQNNKDIKSYFVLAKGVPDADRLSKMGKVVNYGSVKHKLLLLMCSELISSQAEDNIYNPWGSDGKYVKDLLNYNFDFLQHGIIKDNLSDWLNKFNKNLKLFVTSAKPEYKSILKDDYLYGKDVVRLTGLPRYDNLYSDAEPKKSILIMPTWRMGLTLPVNIEGVHPYNPLFKDSSFYEFYQELISDERLNATMEKYGYTGRFVLHAHHLRQIEDFKPTKNFTMVEKPDYQEEFKNNALLVTDYSSVAFDFAYLKKPVIYAQFDEEDFYLNQIYNKGYFDYKSAGLGDVYKTKEEVIDRIINYIETGCVIDSMYIDRINDFYEYFDNNNSKRVYDIIINRRNEE